MTSPNPNQLNPREVNELHRMADKDTSRESLHHTLGMDPYQSSPGDHNHDGRNSKILTVGGHSHSGLVTADTTWTTPVLSNGWVHYGGTATTSSDIHAPFQYRKLADGLVHFRGLITGTNRTTDNPFIFPVGHRPARAYIFAGKADIEFVEFRIYDNGSLNVYSVRPWISITGVFYAEQ